MNRPYPCAVSQAPSRGSPSPRYSGTPGRPRGRRGGGLGRVPFCGPPFWGAFRSAGSPAADGGDQAGADQQAHGHTQNSMVGTPEGLDTAGGGPAARKCLSIVAAAVRHARIFTLPVSAIDAQPLPGADAAVRPRQPRHRGRPNSRRRSLRATARARLHHQRPAWTNNGTHAGSVDGHTRTYGSAGTMAPTGSVENQAGRLGDARRQGRPATPWRRDVTSRPTASRSSLKRTCRHEQPSAPLAAPAAGRAGRAGPPAFGAAASRGNSSG